MPSGLYTSGLFKIENELSDFFEVFDCLKFFVKMFISPKICSGVGFAFLIPWTFLNDFSAASLRSLPISQEGDSGTGNNTNNEIIVNIPEIPLTRRQFV